MRLSLHSPAGGFSMVEVLVTVAVVGVGLLGLAKMQAGTLSSTQGSRTRSLVALQSGSLVGAMHANRRYWASGTAPASWSAAGTTVTDATGVLNASGVDCAGATCTGANLAAFDVQRWVAAMNAKFPTYAAQMTCTTATTAPISCALTVTWNEKTLAINRTTAASAAAMTSTQQFTLYIQP